MKVWMIVEIIGYDEEDTLLRVFRQSPDAINFAQQLHDDHCDETGTKPQKLKVLAVDGKDGERVMLLGYRGKTHFKLLEVGVW